MTVALRALLVCATLFIVGCTVPGTNFTEAQLENAVRTSFARNDCVLKASSSSEVELKTDEMFAKELGVPVSAVRKRDSALRDGLMRVVGRMVASNEFEISPAGTTVRLKDCTPL